MVCVKRKEIYKEMNNLSDSVNTISSYMMTDIEFLIIVIIIILIILLLFVYVLISYKIKEYKMNKYLKWYYSNRQYGDGYNNNNQQKKRKI